MKRTEKGTWSTARVVDKELIPKQRMDSDSLSMKLPISLMDVFASGHVVSSNSNISELHREGRRSHGSSQRFRSAAHRLKTAQLHCQHYIPLFNSCNGQSPSRGSAVNSKGEKACQQQSRHAHLDDRCVGKNVFPKAPDSHRFREVASSGRAGSGVRIRYLTRVRTGSPFGCGLANVPHRQKQAHIRRRDELFAELVQPSHLDFR